MLLIFGSLVIGGYVLSRVLLFGWYVPLYCIPIILASLVPAASDRSPWMRAAFRILLIPIVAALLGCLAQSVRAGTLGPLSAYPEFGTGARVRKYIQVGSDLYKRCPGQTLLSSEIGGLGYGFAGSILDGVGLASPEALAYHPMQVPQQRSSGAIGAIPVGLVKEAQLGLIVSYDGFIEEFLASPLTQSYMRIEDPIYLDDDRRRTSATSVWNSTHLNVFIRNDLVASGLNCYPRGVSAAK